MIGCPKPAPKPVILVCEEAREWIRRQPCLLAKRRPCECGKYVSIETRRTPTECCHVLNKRDNGDFENLVPMCGKHHRYQHDHGKKSFNRKFGVDLTALAVHYWDRFVTETRWVPEEGVNAEV